MGTATRLSGAVRYMAIETVAEREKTPRLRLARVLPAGETFSGRSGIRGAPQGRNPRSRSTQDPSAPDRVRT